ncbi:MAG: GlxA family transcriptional regulator [Planktomarina sp.]
MKLDSQILVPKGAFEFQVSQTRETRWFNFLLLPQFTLLAFSAALEPLRIANQLTQKPLYGWTMLSTDGQPVLSSSGADMNVQGDLFRIDAKAHLIICSGNMGAAVATDPVLDALRRHHRHGGHVGAICTGAATLARAGLLGGKRFTLHWENQPGFVETFPDLKPTPNKFEIDGNLITCGGGATATELMLSVIEADYGWDLAFHISEMCMHNVTRKMEQRSSMARALRSREPKVIAAMAMMHDSLEEPKSISEIARTVEVSKRHLERLFKNVMGISPSQTYRTLRLEHALALINDTNMPIAEIALACGFGTNAHFSKVFKAHFGYSPHAKPKVS